MPHYYQRLLVLTTFTLSLIGCQAFPHLRSSTSNRRNQGQDSINLCFCESCTSAVANTVVDGYSCAERIAWLQREKNMTEIDACHRIAAVEFPNECSACNPDLCQVQPICEVETCTMDVLATQVCDNSFGGCHPCGERIKYAVTSQGLSPKDACEKVSSQQFPEECGKCSSENDAAGTARMVSLTAQPTSTTPITVVTPGASLTAPPAPLPTTPSPTVTAPAASPVASSPNNICGTVTCTQSVLDTLACNDNLGGCHTCGSRIDYLINTLGYAPTDACEVIGFAQFSTECGGCMPDQLRSPVVPVDPYTLLWSDEFPVDGAPDPTKWTYDVGTGDWGWGNNELQYYTDRMDNAFIKDGILNIRAVRESYGGKDYTSARIKTKGFGEWTSGRIQIRARLANGAGRGTWAAAWMLPTDQLYGPWPASGEIDIMEHVGFDPGRFHGTVHTEAFNHMKGTQSGNNMSADLNAWHTHEVIWTADQIDFIVDDFRYHTFRREESSTYREWPFDQRFHIILNIAVGGNWGGVQGVDENAFVGVGQIMEIDWVRVYSV